MGEFKHLAEILKPIIEEITVRKEVEARKPSVELKCVIYELYRDSNVFRNKLEINGDMKWSEFKKRELRQDELKETAISIINKMEEI